MAILRVQRKFEVRKKVAEASDHNFCLAFDGLTIDFTDKVGYNKTACITVNLFGKHKMRKILL